MSILSWLYPISMKSKSVAPPLPPRRRRGFPMYPIILLVLSHSVWNTLQCGSKPYQPDTRSPITVTVSSEENGFETSAGFSNRRGEPQPVSLIAQKKDGDDANQLVEQEPELQLCNHRLLWAVQAVCGVNNYHIPTFEEVSKRASGEMVIQRRLQRSLVSACCQKPCSRSYMLNFCMNKDRIPSTTTTTESPFIAETTTEEEGTETTERVHSDNQLPASSPGEPDPAIYYPLFHFIKFMHRQFGSKNAHRPSTAVEGEERHETGSEELGRAGWNSERDLPAPQARIQQHSHSRDSTFSQPPQEQRQVIRVHPDSYPRQHPRENQRYEGNPYETVPIIGNFDGNDGRGNLGSGNADGVSFTNTAAAAKGAAASFHQIDSSHGGHSRHRHHSTTNPAPTPNTNLDEMALTNAIRNILHLPQGSPKKPSKNVFTSTLPPGVTIIRLGAVTDDQAIHVPFSKDEDEN